MISAGLNESRALVIKFNPTFIKENRIKSITKHISNKADNQIIVDRGLLEQYEFNSSGNLVYSFSTEIKKVSSSEVLDYAYSKKGKRVPYYKNEYSYLYDTTFTYYFYDANNRLSIKRSSIIGREVFKSNYYEYDSVGNIKKETVIREVNAADDVQDFKTGMQTVVSMETYGYEKIAPGQLRKKFFNDEGRIYKTGIIYSDSAKHITEEAFDFVVTWIKERNNYKYNSKGLLIDKKLMSNDGFLSQESYEYDASSTEPFSGMHIFKDGIKTMDISYIFNKENRCIESEVSRDHKNASIGIVKYEYTFEK